MSTKNITIEQRIARVKEMHAEDRIIRGQWSKQDERGREMACYLAALVPGAIGAGDCPADLMPIWVAELLPSIDDNVSIESWPRITQLFVEFVEHIPNITESGWRRVMLKTNLTSLQIALLHDKNNVVQPIIELTERELAGGEVLVAEWKVAARAAWAAGAALAAAWAAARVAAMSTAGAEAAEAAARAAARAARAAAWVAAMSTAGAEAAEAAAWEKIAKAFFVAAKDEALSNK